MRRDRGKKAQLETYNNNDLFNYYSSSSDLPCKKHPSSSPVGICAYCLKDRLVKLVCSDCGEQRLSSCSCSEIEISSSNSNRISCTAGDVGSVGRISFLIENEKPEPPGPNSNSKPEVVMLKRSSSSCVEIKKSSKFWKIGKLFRKKRERSVAGCGDEKSEMWVVDYMGVSRSRSLCSFRGSNFYGAYGSEDGGDYLPVSAARSSISAARSSISAARSSGVNGAMLLDSGRRSGFSEAEPRKSGFGYSSSEAEPRKSSFGYNSDQAELPRKSGFDGEKKDDPNSVELDSSGNRRIFSLKEGDFGGDSGFIDLKFDFSTTESKAEYSAVKMSVLSDHHSLSAFGSMRSCGGGDPGDHHEFCDDHHHHHDHDGIYRNGNSSCRVTVSDRGIKRSRKSFKGWGWIFRQHPNSRSARKKEDDLTLNPCYSHR